jgi:dihydrofolate synthase/folylpolyglutamate synthase
VASPPPPRLAEVLARLDRHVDHERQQGSGIAAGRVAGLSLEPMRLLCHVLGDPQDAVPALHITGTNGKGSVTAMLSSLLVASGLRAGTYTSPHLAVINERFGRGGQPISDDELAEVLTGVLDAATLIEPPPSWFELVTAAAFRWFSEAAVDVAVVEVGLLGRYDATNVVTADVAVITSIGKDHTDGAPGWERAVTSEKAGIITPGRPVIVGPLPEELLAIVEAEGPGEVLMVGRELRVESAAVAVGGSVAQISTPRGTYDELYVPLHGRHQLDNAAIAIGTLEAFLDRRIDDEVVRAGLGSVAIPGRVEVIAREPLVILDGAHNREAAEALAQTLPESFTTLGSRILVLGMLEGRDPAEVLGPLAGVPFDLVVATTPPSPRAQSPGAIAAAAQALGMAVEVIADPWTALERAYRIAAEDDLVVVAGSFYLLDPARTVRADNLPAR